MTTRAKKARNPLRADPTRLAGVRRSFVAAVRRGFAALGVRVQHMVGVRDAFGIGGPVANAETSASKLARFRAWLRTQLDSTLAGGAVVEKYISTAYASGASSGISDAGKASSASATTPEDALRLQGAREQSARALRAGEATAGKVNLLASRTFSEMEGVSARVATRMSRVLADALVTGKTALQAARAMRDEAGLELPRALLVVQTELTRAHAEGTLDALEESGVASVGAVVEFQTGGDPCPLCAKLEGREFTVAQARGLIPVHPRCLCRWQAAAPRRAVRSRRAS